VAKAKQLARKVVAEIHAARDCGVVHCGVSAHPSPSLAEVAAEFGLAPDLASYKEIDAASARRLAELVLNQDMAYNAEIMPADRAAELAGRFLAQFGTDGVRYYTNGTFHEPRGPKLTWSGAGWDPVTEATFDTGVLVLGPGCSGCLWVEDED
jgi:hypothetical protein